MRKGLTASKSLAACIIFIVFAGLSSCDYLSITNYTDNDLKIDTIFTQKRYIEAYMWGAASYFPDEGELYANPHTPGPMATDEAFCLYTNFPGMRYVVGELDENNLGSLNRWKSMYQVIRQCNTIFARMDECRDWTISDRMRITAYTRFIRAYAYYHLLMNHGPVVLLGDELVNNNEELAFYDRPRDLYDDCVEYICTELEEAALFLPVRVQSIIEFGLPTKGAALGLVARLRLQHASDLYNGGPSARTYFSSWTRKTDGKHYIQQTYEPKRWAVAAAAAKELIDMRDQSGMKMYNLHTVAKDNRTPALSPNTDDPHYLEDFPNGAGGIDPYHSYLDMFNGETVTSVNPEFVWARSSAAATNAIRYSFPVANGGNNGLCVTQKIVDAYEMADGRPITNPTSTNPTENFSYSETGFTTSQRMLYTDYPLNRDVYNMYVNREARFYASIGFSECYWEMASGDQTRQTITYYSNSPNGRFGTPNPTQYPITGYVLKKYIHPIDAWIGTSPRRLNKPFAMIRYAEILLAYAEALNQLGDESFVIDMNGEPQTFSRNFSEIKWAFNLVRYRAGLPGLTDADNNAALILTKIKRERMVEFLYENQRYFDIRRWGDYESSEREAITGMNTSAPQAAYYQRVVPPSARIAQRIVDRKMIFVPIPKAEMKRLPSFDQNPGW